MPIADIDNHSEQSDDDDDDDNGHLSRVHKRLGNDGTEELRNWSQRASPSPIERRHRQDKEKKKEKSFERDKDIDVEGDDDDEDETICSPCRTPVSKCLPGCDCGKEACGTKVKRKLTFSD